MTECIDHGRHGDKQRYASGYLGGGRAAPVYQDLHVQALVKRTGEHPNGRLACHTCNNKRCINGEHLYWGTKSTNTMDCIAAGNHFTPFRKVRC